MGVQFRTSVGGAPCGQGPLQIPGGGRGGHHGGRISLYDYSGNYRDGLSSDQLSKIHFTKLSGGNCSVRETNKDTSTGYNSMPRGWLSTIVANAGENPVISAKFSGETPSFPRLSLISVAAS